MNSQWYLLFEGKREEEQQEKLVMLPVNWSSMGIIFLLVR